MSATYPVEKLRKDFPALQQKVHGKSLVYLDNAATTQKPRSVIDAEARFYEQDNANIHRGVHLLSQRATEAYEASRAKVAKFIGARHPEEIIWTRGTTEAINLVAQAFVRPRLNPGDEVLVTRMEHHSNIVPWQLICGERKATLQVADITDKGELDMRSFKLLLNQRTRFVSVSHVSNALGTVNPVKDIVKLAHERGVPVLVDGAQAVPHQKVDVAALGADFYAASGHKMYGPTGIGFLYGKREHLESMPPYQGGGDMIASVSFEKGTTYNQLPWKFEAGTPNIAGGIVMGAAVDYLTAIGMDKIHAHEEALLAYATKRVGEVKGLKIIGQAREKAGVLSFTLGDIHAHDIGSILDREGVAVRTGHHCAMPVMDRFGLPATTRASFGLYNTRKDVDRLVSALQKVAKVFG